MNTAVILAGGVGTRVGANIPKQFICVLDKPIIIHTLEVFENNDNIDQIEIVCIKEYISYLKQLLKKYHITKVKYIVEGGCDFQHSVINGINGLEGKVKDDDIVMIHWAASPFVSQEIIDDNINVAKQKGNAISASPAILLYGIKEADSSTIEGIDRDSFMVMNAPQSFQYSYIRNLYQEAINNQLLNQVEPHTTSLMYMMKQRIYFSKGSQINIKITTSEDLLLFEGFLLAKNL